VVCLRKSPEVLANRTHGWTGGGIFVPTVIHHLAQFGGVCVRDIDTDHGSAVGGFLAGQNVYRDTVVVPPEWEWDQTRQNL